MMGSLKEHITSWVQPGNIPVFLGVCRERPKMAASRITALLGIASIVAEFQFNV